MRAQRLVLGASALIVGLVGAFDGVVVNVVVSTYHDVQRVLGGDADPSHGIIGFVICMVALVGAVLALRNPLIGGILLFLAGVAFFFIVHWWALLASPQMLVAAALAFMDRSGASNVDRTPIDRTPTDRTALPA